MILNSYSLWQSAADVLKNITARGKKLLCSLMAPYSIKTNFTLSFEVKGAASSFHESLDIEIIIY